MRVDLFDFELPQDSIAIRPARPRDSARLLLVEGHQVSDHKVLELPDLLRPGDVLIFNDTKVIPAQLEGRRGEASIGATLHKRESLREWYAFLRNAKRAREGDVIECPARQARIVDPAWSRFKVTQPFAWPTIEGQCANVVPLKDGTMDFFYLYELTAGEMWWRRPSAGLKFGYQFDTSVFPYAWCFASYGGFLDHYTVILEPCTAMPVSVKEASEKRQCSRLEPGETLRSHVSLYAGPI